jgi:hypothetical protein
MYADGWKAVTLHGQRRPWQIASTFPFDEDLWWGRYPQFIHISIGANFQHHLICL